MPTKYMFGLFLAGGLLISLKAPAQVVTDSLQFREAKLRIWCEAIGFVYQDYGADSLSKTLNCRSWEGLQQSITHNTLQVNSFFQAIEKPSIYQGYTTFDAKLQKLRDEIVRKLKSSPGRIADPVRLKKVDSLQESLLLAAASAPSQENTDQQEVAVPVRQESSLNKSNTAAVSRSQQENTTLPEDEENTMNWTEIAQWTLLLLLTAGLVLLWAKYNKLESDMNQRMKRRKQEISAISRINESMVPPQGKAKPAPAVAPALSKAEVQSLIHSEIDKLRQQQKTNRQQAEARHGTKRQEPQERSQPQPAKQPAVEKTQPRPQAVNAEQKETRETGKPEAGIFYDKLPFKGGFHQNQLSTHRHPDSIYSIQLLPEKPDEAEFWVTEDQEVQKYAMQNGLSFFEEACDYNQVEENPSRVRNLEKGKLRKNGHLWQIEKKVKVTFE